MERQSRGASDRRPTRSDADAAVYRLKTELRREEREGRGDGLYANVLRRILRILTDHEPDEALGMVEKELLDVRARSDIGIDEVMALRRVLGLIEPRSYGSRELFAYYLRKLEAAGRGEEPFARALRKALASQGASSLAELLYWGMKDDAADSTDEASASDNPS